MAIFPTTGQWGEKGSQDPVAAGRSICRDVAREHWH